MDLEQNNKQLLSASEGISMRNMVILRKTEDHLDAVDMKDNEPALLSIFYSDFNSKDCLAYRDKDPFGLCDDG